MTVVPFSRWCFTLRCVACEEGEVCDCSDDIKGRTWTLSGTSGMIQQFYPSGSYYGTWGGGRTGSMETLEACKKAVEKAVWHD